MYLSHQLQNIVRYGRGIGHTYMYTMLYATPILKLWIHFIIKQKNPTFEENEILIWSNMIRHNYENSDHQRVLFCFKGFFFRVKQECGRYGESFRVPISFATQAISNIIDSFLGKTWLHTTIACLFYCLRKEPYLSYIWFLLNMNNSFFWILLDV